MDRFRFWIRSSLWQVVSIQFKERAQSGVREKMIYEMHTQSISSRGVRAQEKEYQLKWSNTAENRQSVSRAEKLKIEIGLVVGPACLGSVGRCKEEKALVFTEFFFSLIQFNIWCPSSHFDGTWLALRHDHLLCFCSCSCKTAKWNINKYAQQY